MQKKRYVEEMFHLGTSVYRQRLDSDRASVEPRLSAGPIDISTPAAAEDLRAAAQTRTSGMRRSTASGDRAQRAAEDGVQQNDRNWAFSPTPR